MHVVLIASLYLFLTPTFILAILPDLFHFSLLHAVSSFLFLSLVLSLSLPLLSPVLPLARMCGHVFVGSLAEFVGREGLPGKGCRGQRDEGGAQAD